MYIRLSHLCENTVSLSLTTNFCLAIARIHLMQLELMYPQVASRALRVDAAPFTLQGGHQVAAVPATASSSSSSAAAVASTIGAVAIENLVTRGVHGDVVRQIADIQAYVGQVIDFVLFVLISLLIS